MTPAAVIAAVRDGHPVPKEALGDFVLGVSDGAVSDAQVGAFAMAVLLRGVSGQTRTDLTLAMRDSGRTLDWGDGPPVIDKHSTGGIGDCVSLVLAPALAACGARVPMISGRGLGHTGGTLDKIEAIPGVQTGLEEARLRHIVDRTGCVIAGATADLAPADRRLYAIRDVTATVESIDLITASILSKKLAAGLEGLVLDVKLGTGAFMKDQAAAMALARSLVDTANAAGCQSSALITDMNQPLAPAAGNALEVAEAMRVLTGQATGHLASLSAALGGVALAGAGLSETVEAGARHVARAITDGRAAECFGRMVALMGGPVRFVDTWQRFLPEATVIRELAADRGGYVSGIDAEALGHAVIDLGGGRRVETDAIDPAVGLSQIVRLGEKVDPGAPLLRIHATRTGQADGVEHRLRAAIHLSDTAPDLPPLIHDRIT